MKTKTGWKILKKGMESHHNNFKWRKNKWYKHEGEIKLCKEGFHASDELVSALRYCVPGIICKVEYRGEIIVDEDKFVASEMRIVETYRFTKRMAVEWSIYCAKQCYKNWLSFNKSDKRVLKAIQAAEVWFRNPTAKNELATWSASQSAWSAARSAANSAWSADSADSAQSAAQSAAHSARSAARSVAQSARSAAQLAQSAWSAAQSAQSAMKNKLHKKLLKIIGATNK